MTASSELYLGRQPILDRDQKIVAYELLFRNSQRNFAEVACNTRATATVIANAFTELSIGDALGPCRGFINVDENILFSDVVELLPRQSVVLEILETVTITPAVVERCRELRNSGFMLALDDIVQLGDEYQPLFELVEIVKIDLQPLDRTRLAELTGKVRRLGLQCLAEKVDSQEQMDHCVELGFDLFQGYYFARPKIIQGRKLDPSQLAVLQLTNLLLADADDGEIEHVLKQEPALTLNLLRLTNSVAVAAPRPISSLRQAIAVLGRRQLQRWLQLLLYASGKRTGNAVSPLLQVAATRGRLMELLADRVAPKDSAFADHAFMAGILSLTPVLFGIPIVDIVAQLALDPTTRAALCDGPGPGSGRLGDLLQLTEQIEADDEAGAAATLCRLPEIDRATLNLSLSQALAWANKIGREA